MIQILLRLDSLSEFKTHKFSNPIIYVVSPQINNEFKYHTFFKEFNNDFIIELNFEQQENIDLILDSHLHFLFHKCYFFINNVPLIKLTHEVSASRMKRIHDFFIDQGYSDVHLYIENDVEPKLFSYDNNKNLLKIHKYKSSERNDIELFLPNNFLICDRIEQVKKINSSFDEILNENKQLKLFANKIDDLYFENNQLINEINWFKNQLDNHKKYLIVIKNKLRKKELFNLGGGFANFIRRAGFLRKISKKMYDKYQKYK